MQENIRAKRGERPEKRPATPRCTSQGRCLQELDTPVRRWLMEPGCQYSDEGTADCKETVRGRVVDATFVFICSATAEGKQPTTQDAR